MADFKKTLGYGPVLERTGPQNSNDIFWVLGIKITQQKNTTALGTPY